MRQLRVLDLNHVKPEVRFDYRDLSRLHCEHRVLERLDHLAASERAEVAALEFVRRIIRYFAASFAKSAPSLVLASVLLRFGLRRPFSLSDAPAGTAIRCARVNFVRMLDRVLALRL